MKDEIGKILQSLELRARKCHRCELSKTRLNVVFGAGPETAEVMVVSEAPGATEDQTGIPFTGAAGKKLDGLLAEAGLDRNSVYICNVLKCRPPGNRDPLPEEIEACRPFLVGQISAIKPKLIVALGRIAAGELLGRRVAMAMEHGTLVDCVYFGVKFKLFITYHPAAGLYGAEAGRRLREDFKKLGAIIEAIQRTTFLQ